MLCNFSVRMLKYFCPQKVKKPPQKVAYLWQLGVCSVGSLFFSAATTAPNSPELHFRFINSFIQPSLVASLVSSKVKWILPLKKEGGIVCIRH